MRSTAPCNCCEILVRLQIELEARSTSGVNNINSQEIRALRFQLPPLAEQQEIVRRVEALFALADQIEARFQNAQAQVAKLTPSLLARAYRGQLVPQDPNDESAEKLLERIHAESKTNVPQGRSRIAQRFIAGFAAQMGASPVRDERIPLRRIYHIRSPSGTRPVCNLDPRLKPWAILGRPWPDLVWQGHLSVCEKNLNC